MKAFVLALYLCSCAAVPVVPPTSAPHCNDPVACSIPRPPTDKTVVDASRDPLLEPIVFRHGIAMLTHSDEMYLNVVAAHIVENYMGGGVIIPNYIGSGIKFRVEGIATTQPLADARAREVINYLVSQGVPKDQLERAVSIGSDEMVRFVPYIAGN